MVRSLPADVHEAKRAIVAPHFRVVERLERGQRVVMRERRVLRLTHADRRFALCPHARTMPLELLHEVGWVRQEVTVQVCVTLPEGVMVTGRGLRVRTVILETAGSSIAA